MTPNPTSTELLEQVDLELGEECRELLKQARDTEGIENRKELLKLARQKVPPTWHPDVTAKMFDLERLRRRVDMNAKWQEKVEVVKAADGAQEELDVLVAEEKQEIETAVAAIKEKRAKEIETRRRQVHRASLARPLDVRDFLARDCADPERLGYQRKLAERKAEIKDAIREAEETLRSFRVPPGSGFEDDAERTEAAFIERVQSFRKETIEPLEVELQEVIAELNDMPFWLAISAF